MDRDDLLGLVDQVALLLPEVPRLMVLDVVDAERERLRAVVEPFLAAFVMPAAVWRLRAGVDAIGA